MIISINTLLIFEIKYLMFNQIKLLHHWNFSVICHVTNNKTTENKANKILGNIIKSVNIILRKK